MLDLSARQVRRLLDRIRTDGAASIRHKAIGRPSNNRISDGVQDYAVTLVRECYADFSPSGSDDIPGEPTCMIPLFVVCLGNLLVRDVRAA